MLENLRRKSLSYTYNSLIHEIHFEQGHVIYKNLSSIGYHRTRYSKVEALKSFPNTFESVGKRFWVIYDMIGRVKFNMIFCPSGKFVMGHELQGYNEPRPEVIERPFLLGETEVTQELYEEVLDDNPSAYSYSYSPVESVTWFDAIDFCNKLSELQGLDLCYTKNAQEECGWVCDFDKNGYRLPTEKEWEYAAKAGTQNRWSGTDAIEELGKYALCKVGNDVLPKSTRPVKSKLPNGWGFYDMSGNVWEWCWGKYDSSDSSLKDYGVRRGGAWLNNDADYLSSSYRSKCKLFESASCLGFRVCRTFVS